MSDSLLPTERELDAIYGDAFRRQRDCGVDPTPAHRRALVETVEQAVDHYLGEVGPAMCDGMCSGG